MGVETLSDSLVYARVEQILGAYESGKKMGLGSGKKGRGG